MLQWAQVEKTVNGMKTHWLSSKEKVLDTAVSKKGYANSLLRQERTYHCWFPWKVQQSTVLPNAIFFGKIYLIYRMTLVCIYIYIYIYIGSISSLIQISLNITTSIVKTLLQSSNMQKQKLHHFCNRSSPDDGSKLGRKY